MLFVVQATLLAVSVEDLLMWLSNTSSSKEDPIKPLSGFRDMPCPKGRGMSRISVIIKLELMDEA